LKDRRSIFVFFSYLGIGEKAANTVVDLEERPGLPLLQQDFSK
jgi:hypothetical protein